MNKRTYFYLSTFLIFAVFLSFTTIKKEKTRVKPNILFIAVDDLRPEIASFGIDHIKSPSIDKLASESLVFDRAYCNVPVCGASRASLLSGVRPGMFRYIGYSTKQQEDYPGALSLPMHFKNNGYATISNGKIYHHKSDDKDAWDEVWGPKNTNNTGWRDYQTEENIRLDAGTDKTGYPYEAPDIGDSEYFDGKIADKSIEDLKKLKDSGKPFFLAAGFLKPHLPFNAPKKYWDLYNRDNISLPENYLQPETTPNDAYHNFGELRAYYGVPEKGPVSEEMAKELIHGYYACVSYTDAQIGRLLSALDDLGLAENTIVILWGDHGWNLGDHMLWCKHCNFESSLHVPMILKVPGKTSGQHTSAITEYIDIYPSLSELAGLPIPKHVDGESFVPLIEGEKMKKDFAISKYHDGVTIVKGSMFYTEFIDNKGNVKARMLFDHSNDPMELNNLAEKPEYAEKVKELSKLLRNNWGYDFFEDRRVNETSVLDKSMTADDMALAK